MNEQTLKALNKSIAHWEEMAKNGWKNEQPTIGQCPLCQLFRIRPDHFIETCGECPIATSGHYLCSETPYYDAERAYGASDELAFKEAAYREVDFLKSLLPETDEQPRNEAETLQP